MTKIYSEEQIFGVFLYGSQNYGVARETSDVDTKVIYIPTWREIAYEKPVSKEIVLPNGEHCEVKDIREMIRMFSKQNLNFLEILFTNCAIINRPDLYGIWERGFLKNKEEIARLDVAAGVRSMAHQALNKIYQNRGDGKKVATGYRLLVTITKYLAGKDYRSCFYLDEIQKEVFNSIRDGNFNEAFIDGICSLLSIYADGAYDNYESAKNRPAPNNKRSIISEMEEAALDMIDRFIIK